MSNTPRNTTTRDRDRAAIRRTKPPCGICEGEIDYSLTVLEGQHGRRCKGAGCRGCVPHPMRFEVDHKIPLGPNPTPERIAELDVLANKQASHRKCNRDKWDKLADELADELGPRTFVTTRSW